MANIYPNIDMASEGTAGPYEGIPQLLDLWKSLNPVDFAPLAMTGIKFGPRSLVYKTSPEYKDVVSKDLPKSSAMDTGNPNPQHKQLPVQMQEHVKIYPDVRQEKPAPMFMRTDTQQRDIEEPLRLLGQIFQPDRAEDINSMLKWLDIAYGGRYRNWGRKIPGGS